MTFIFICLLLLLYGIVVAVFVDRVSLSLRWYSLSILNRNECVLLLWDEFVHHELNVGTGRSSSLSLAMYLLCFARIDSCLCHTRHFFFNALTLSFSSLFFSFPEQRPNRRWRRRRRRWRWWTATAFSAEWASIYLSCFVTLLFHSSNPYVYVFNNFK